MARPLDAPLEQYEIDCCRRDEVYRITRSTFNIPFYLMLAVIYVAPLAFAILAKDPALQIGAVIFSVFFGVPFLRFPLSLADDAAEAGLREYAADVIEGRRGWHQFRWQPAGENFHSLPEREWPVSTYDKIGEQVIRFPRHWGSTVRIMKPQLRVRLAAPVQRHPSGRAPIPTVVAIEGGPSIAFEYDCGLGAYPAGATMVMIWHAAAMTGLGAVGALTFHGFTYLTAPLVMVACGFALWALVIFVRERVFMWRLARAYSKANVCL